MAVTNWKVFDASDCIGDGLGLAGRAADQILAAGCGMAEALEIMRAKLLIRALEASGGNINAASRTLQQHRNTTARELGRLHLEDLAAKLRKLATAKRKIARRQASLLFMPRGDS